MEEITLFTGLLYVTEKMLNILLTLSYNTMKGLPTSHKTIAAYGEEMVIHLLAELSVTDKQLCTAFFEYVSYNYYYILLFL
jgi:hypothetical protein